MHSTIFIYKEIIMNLTGLTLNTSDAMEVAVIVLVASGVIWGIRRALSFVR